MTGRPAEAPFYSLELALAICEQVSEGRSLRSALRDAGMPSVAKWFRWLGEHKDELSEHYARARMLRAQVRADDIIDIADDDTIPVEDRKLRCAMRQWEASKLDRANYGDRQQVEHSGGVRLDVVTGVPEPDQSAG